MIASALILAGMHLPNDEIRAAIRRLPDMIESVTFQVFEDLGAAKALREAVLLLGSEKFGKPTDEQKQKLGAIEDLARLKRLTVRVLKVDDWDALLRGR